MTWILPQNLFLRENSRSDNKQRKVKSHLRFQDSDLPQQPQARSYIRFIILQDFQTPTGNSVFVFCHLFGKEAGVRETGDLISQSHVVI
jgi:hypothetical protein